MFLIKLNYFIFIPNFFIKFLYFLYSIYFTFLIRLTILIFILILTFVVQDNIFKLLFLNYVYCFV